jgi:membrane protein
MSQQQKTTYSLSIHRLIDWANAPVSGDSLLLKKLHSFVRIVFITGKEFSRNELNIRASALTYTILLSLVPMLAMSTAILKGMGGSDQLQTVVYSYIDTLAKTTPLTTSRLSQLQNITDLSEALENASESTSAVTTQFRSVAEQIFSYVDRTNFAALGTIGVLGVLFSAILVLANIELSMNTIWHVPSGRSFLRKVTDYLTLLILMPISINVGFFANTILKNDTLLNKILHTLPGPLVQTGLLLLVPLFFIIITLFFIYIFFPNTKVNTGPALIGAVFAGSFWFITQNLYIGLQIGVSKYNAIYGSFASLPLFLVWLFLGWVFILSGAQLAFACQRQNSYQLRKRKHTPTEQISAAFDMLRITYDSFTAKSKLVRKDLPRLCPTYSAELLLDTLQKLDDAQIIEISKKGRILPAVPGNELQYQEVFVAILGDSFPDTEGGKAAASILQQTKPLLSNRFSVN